MEITTFKKDYLPDMAQLFIQNYSKLRQTVPILPELWENPERIIGMLEGLAEVCPGVVVLQGNKVLGYMGWYLIDHFRGTERKCAFCTEWGHGAVEEAKSAVYRAMYRAASQYWVESGCHVHGLTLLADDWQAREVWFWNGFGLTVVDAIRSTQPLGNSLPVDFIIRQATPDDVDVLQVMDSEHGQHYRQAPVLMEAYHPSDTDALLIFLAEPQNSIWLAMDGDKYVGFLRFDAHNRGSASIVAAPDQVANTGAYVRPHYRGRSAASAMLDAALRYYAALGFTRCSVDF